MTTEFNMDKFLQGGNGFGLPFCDAVYSATLTGATDTAIAVPLTGAMGNVGARPLDDAFGRPAASARNKYIAVFSYAPGAAVWVAKNVAAAVPAGAAFVLGAELNPPAKVVQAGDVIHFFSTAAASLSVAFYAIQE